MAQESMQKTSTLAEQIKETKLHDDIKQVIHKETELLDITGDLILFLRLKSNKVTI